MQRSLASSYRHPHTGRSLSLEITRLDEAHDVVEGALVGDGDSFPIVRGIPRFCPAENYAMSFGYQWQAFALTQLDSRAAWAGESRKRLFAETRWSSALGGQRILEAGSGMGRFTEVLATTGASVCTFDYSSAIEANLANNHGSPNVAFAQADLFCPPYEQGSFDKVLCIGVIQHTPSPRQAFRSLVRFLRPGGEIVIDCYRLSWKSVLHGKYYLRPLTTRMDPKLLHRFVKTHVGLVYPLTSVLQPRLDWLGRKISRLLGVADYRGVFDIDERAARELAELDTLDNLAPTFDQPQTLAQVYGWFTENGLVDVDVRPGFNGIEGRGRRPA